MTILRPAMCAVFLALGMLASCSSSSDTSPPDAGIEGGNVLTPDSGDNGGDKVTVVDASSGEDASLDASDAADVADAAPVQLAEVHGEVRGMGSGVKAKVTVLSPHVETMSDDGGGFSVNLPLGAAVVIKVEPVDTSYLPMIRGLVVIPLNRTRRFYLVGPPELGAFQSLGFTVDPNKALAIVDFRNVTQGGYSVTLKNSSGTVIDPGFGAALDGMGTPQSTMITLAGKAGSTIYLGNVDIANVSFSPHIGDAGLPCQPCDGPSLPTQAGVATWYDFECGSANDCL